MKGWLRSLIFGACEQLWAFAFALVGRIHRPQARAWLPIGNGRVLVVAPHPDDECAGCGGTIVRHRRAGDQVTVLQVTDGRGARAARSAPAAMTQTRAHEAQAAAAALGACLELLALPEYEWSEAELCAELQRRLARSNPDVVYAPSCIDFHPEHLRVARALAVALEGARPQLLIRLYVVSVPLTPSLINCVSDTSAVTAEQDTAIAAYRSQWVALLPVKRLRLYWARYFRVATSAEVFWQMSARAYQILMEQGDWLGTRPWTPALPPYRSVRARPFTDPLAFWRGKDQRRQLQRVVGNQP